MRVSRSHYVRLTLTHGGGALRDVSAYPGQAINNLPAAGASGGRALPLVLLVLLPAGATGPGGLAPVGGSGLRAEEPPGQAGHSPIGPCCAWATGAAVSASPFRPAA